MKVLPGLASIAGDYDGFILDLWGVVHDGIQPFAGALECLRELQGKPVLLLSNAPRRASAVQHSLRQLGVADASYTHILTSGEATWIALRDRSDPWFRSLGRRVFHIGPARDRGVFEGLGLTAANSPSAADFVLNTGPDDQRESQSVEDFIPELSACLAAGLKMICANPDLEIVRGTTRIICAGALAVWYEAHGGDVHWFGKPDPSIYAAALARLDVPSDRVLAIGDSLRTDIAGAAAAGLHSLWILGGIHQAEFGFDIAAARSAAQSAGLDPHAAMASLSW